MTYTGIERRAGIDRRDTATTGRTTLTSATSSGRSEASRAYDERMAEVRDAGRQTSVIAPGLLVGFGLGGLLYGIVFSRLLDWHHVLSGDTAMTGTGLTENLRADGIVDAVSFVALVLGIVLMWNAAWRMLPRAGDRSGIRIAGWMLAGWALFNIAEATLFHVILGWHHVNETAGANVSLWDWGFTVTSIIVGLAGLAMALVSDADRGPVRTDATGR